MSTQVEKFQKLKDEVEKLNEAKVRLETNIETIENNIENTTDEILKLTKTKTLEEAKVKVEAIQERYEKLMVDVDKVFKEIEEYERTA